MQLVGCLVRPQERNGERCGLVGPPWKKAQSLAALHRSKSAMDNEGNESNRHRNSDACSYKSLVEVMANRSVDASTRSSAGSLKPEHQLRKMMQGPRARSMVDDLPRPSRRLVRQKATEQYTMEASSESSEALMESRSNRMSRQWTIDATSNNARRAKSPLSINLTRPQQSYASCSSLTPRLGEMRGSNLRMKSFTRSYEAPNRRHNHLRSTNNARSVICRATMNENAKRLALSGSHQQLGQRSSATLSKQRTSESAPNHSLGVTESGNRSGFLRQTSNASAFSVIYSQPGMTLVRGASCSLVDIPTYLGPTIASNGVEVLAHSVCETANLANVGGHTSPVLPMINSSPLVISRNPRRRLQLDLRRKTDPKTSRKTQWTVLCVTLTLLTLAVTLVGTMLSVGGEYQEQLIARQLNKSIGNRGFFDTKLLNVNRYNAVISTNPNTTIT